MYCSETIQSNLTTSLVRQTRGPAHTSTYATVPSTSVASPVAFTKVILIRPVYLALDDGITSDGPGRCRELRRGRLMGPHYILLLKLRLKWCYSQRRPNECDSLFLSFCIRERAPLFFSRIVTPVGSPTTPVEGNCLGFKQQKRKSMVGDIRN